MEPERPESERQGGTPPDKRASNAYFMALAWELPFTMVGPILVVGLLGFLADRYLGTGPFLLILGCAAGFYAGLREVMRRLKQMDKPSNGKRSK